jgi:hypothetical protein
MTVYSQGNIERVLDQVFPSRGVFLEIGAWRGEHFSQTAYLERERGWTGVCVDPFPMNFESRSCQVCTRAISADGRARTFIKVSTDRRYGGDVSYFSGFKDLVMRSIHWPVIAEHCTYEEIQLETITFDRLCKLYALPGYIDFLSVDIEGGEIELFGSIDFNVHRFGLIAFEHNMNQIVKRAIGQILVDHGYELLEAWEYDDIYVHPHKAWLDNEYRQWIAALRSSTVFDFKDHPMVARMLGEIRWPLPHPDAVDLDLLTQIDNIGRSTASGITGTALRMIHYAQIVLDRDPRSIIEIGGGVGQFYATLRALGYQGDYYICNLTEVQAFQRRYLQEVERQTGLRLPLSAPRMPLDLQFEFCVSFYALGEFDDKTKAWYVENVVKKCHHGFVVWNPHSGASTAIDFPCRVMDEVPLLHAGNKQLEW